MGMTDFYDEHITAMKASERRHPLTGWVKRPILQNHRNAERLAAYRRKRMERQGTAQRIFWGPW